MSGCEGHAVIHCGDGPHTGWHTFRNPATILRTRKVSDVAALVRQAADATQAGWKVAGFVAYEAAPAFDHALIAHPPDGWLAWFGLYPADHVRRGIEPPVPFQPVPMIEWKADIDEAAFSAGIASIREHIAAGETYQVNFTHRLHAETSTDAWSVFLDRLLVQPVPHAAYLDMGDAAICSWSPELFFHQHGRRVVCRPMKGTARPQSDIGELRGSGKNRAENIMIVDMIRNDLGRVATPGTVRADRLFEVENYASVQQMTSTVTAETDTDWAGVFGALFPCASVTGAPKVRTMRIIHALEPSARGVYTGAVGFAFAPREAAFNVAIRTAAVDRPGEVMEYGVGSGVVWDSVAAEEWEECSRKSSMLRTASPGFDLLETLRWEPEEQYIHLEHHLQRLLKSASFWGFQDVKEEALRGALHHAAATWSGTPMRARLLAGRHGVIRVEGSPLAPAPARVRAVLDDRPVPTSDPLLYHKTTLRSVYDRARARHPEADDVLLWNAAGHACEFTIGNLVVELDGRRITPPVHHGLLPGVRRALDVESGRIHEAAVTLDDLKRASAVYRINSLRGWTPVDFVG